MQLYCMSKLWITLNTLRPQIQIPYHACIMLVTHAFFVLMVIFPDRSVFLYKRNYMCFKSITDFILFFFTVAQPWHASLK